jgi:hypothetical protein
MIFFAGVVFIALVGINRWLALNAAKSIDWGRTFPPATE